ncbi:MAG: type II toxin-antitoxin system HicA family toxin [Candidatus Peribacteria bacterium]|nr:type II toxin-antitoxin system HicA family toxin [Candidatus Peribacteria bacterium]
MGIRNREYAEIVRLLKAYGCYYDRNGGGSHEVWYRPLNNRKSLN